MILIIDFGSQFTQLIARRIRELKVYCQVEPPSISIDQIKEIVPAGIILSGGPSSVYEEKHQIIDRSIYKLGIPILGICYGMHLIVTSFGGEVKNANKGEYGFASISLTSSNASKIFKNVKDKSTIWMSHGDSIQRIPFGFNIDALTTNKIVAAISNIEKNLYGIQFHPEVRHTSYGKKIIENFVILVCQCVQTWEIKSFLNKAISNIENTVGDKSVILGLSGGIDSLVAALLLEKAIGDRLTCIIVDNGLLRKNEFSYIKENVLDYLNCSIRTIDARNKFLDALSGVSNPEKKRKIIGEMFVKIFSFEAKKIKNIAFLAQGTLYSDVIESRSVFGGSTSLIKSHHNVGGLPKKMKLKLIEPLKYLFKDEVRSLAYEMKLEEKVIWRQPFPGPGLAIRIMGQVTPEKLSLLRGVDEIIEEEIKKAGYYKKLWQSFGVLLSGRSVGVMGDRRTYDSIVGIRAVTSVDAMTADWARLPHDLIAKMSNRITNEIKGVNRVMYDITSKPPSTIELE